LQASASESVGNTALLPSSLLRAFGKERYALSFVKGEVRFGPLGGYREAKDQRRDETEGEVSILWNLRNPVFCERELLNPCHVLCASHPDTDTRKLRERYGKYLVRISDPNELKRRIDNVWRKSPIASGLCRLEPVVYNKGELLYPTPLLLPPYEYAFTQKPKVRLFDGMRFEEDREIRYVLISKVEQPEDSGRASPITLAVGDCSDILFAD
jgi:hypothetical protein